MATQTETKATIDKIKSLLEEYSSFHEEMDLFKVSVEVYDIVREDLKEDHNIAENTRDYWLHLSNRAEK